MMLERDAAARIITRQVIPFLQAGNRFDVPADVVERFRALDDRLEVIRREQEGLYAYGYEPDAAPADEQSEPDDECDELNANQVAQILRVSRQALSLMRLSGRGPAFTMVGRRVYYRRDDVRQYLSDRAEQREAELATTGQG